METFFNISSFLILILSLIFNVSLSKKIKSLQNQQETLQECLRYNFDGVENDFVALAKDMILLKTTIGDINSKIAILPETIKQDTCRILVDQKESLSPTKPIKPNNWDSLKEVFKGPSRINVNERN